MTLGGEGQAFFTPGTAAVVTEEQSLIEEESKQQKTSVEKSDEQEAMDRFDHLVLGEQH